MNILSTIVVAFLFMLLSLAPLAHGADLEVVKKIGAKAESGLVRDFSEALYRRNHMAMREIVARNRNAVSEEANRTLSAPRFCSKSAAPTALPAVSMMSSTMMQ